MKQKLYAQRGATIMAALLFFLVAAVCGSIILAAATATASRVKNQAKDAQAYYAVTSAARLIRDDLMDSKWKLTLSETYDGSSSMPTAVSVTKLELMDSTTRTFVNDLIIDGPGTDELVKDNEISIKSSLSDLPQVYAKATKRPKLSAANDVLPLEITLTNYEGANKFDASSYKETDDKGNQLYWVSVELHSVRVPELDAVESDSRGADGKGTVVRTIGLTWYDPIIRKVER